MTAQKLKEAENIGFSAPTGTHDDVFWSIALSVYATNRNDARTIPISDPR